MKAIYKYPLDARTMQKVKLPVGSKILSVGNQRNGIVVWAEVDPKEEEKETVFFWVYTTGEEYLQRSTQSVFLGTIQISLSNEYVVHVFYEKIAI
ncbi:hypothetical protein ACI2JA_15585 [Alkalihalobacillus sp. NPDC078783]